MNPPPRPTTDEPDEHNEQDRTGGAAHPVVGDLQRDWARLDTAAGLAEVQAQDGGGSGVAFAWETLLLATPAPEAQPEPTPVRTYGPA